MKIVFLINVDWFFVSHFLHLARRAKARGWDVALACEVSDRREELAREGIELIELPVRRGGLKPSGVTAAAATLADVLRSSPGCVLHAFGKFGIVVGTLAARRARHRRRVFTITGRGYAAVSPRLDARAVRSLTALFCSRVADGPDTRWLAENASDLAACGLERAIGEGRTRLVGGAGIDPARYAPLAMPPRPPLKCALVARMIWSKGIDTAVAAVALARQQGVDVTLSLVGPTDEANPHGLTATTLRGFEGQQGVRWLGRSDDVRQVWAAHHLCVLPSRGGEGVPKSLIEAAACGRPVVTSDVPGCRELAEATGGWYVPAGDAAALARILVEAAAAGEAGLAARGAAARQAVLAHYTEDHVWRETEALYRSLFDGAAG